MLLEITQKGIRIRSGTIADAIRESRSAVAVRGWISRRTAKPADAAGGPAPDLRQNAIPFPGGAGETGPA
jgi:hypothetical protein